MFRLIYYYAKCRYAECRYVECSYAVCRYAVCRYAECRGASLGNAQFHSSWAQCFKTYFVRNLLIFVLN